MGVFGIHFRLKEQDEFDYLFSQAGFRVNHDLADVDDGRIAKNVVLDADSSVPDSVWEEVETFGTTVYWLPETWTRIDFDDSVPSNPQKTEEFLCQNSDSLKTTLGNNRYRLLELAYLSWSPYKEALTRIRLRSLIVFWRNISRKY